MKPWIWLRVAAALQGLGAVLHTIASMDSPSRGPAEAAVFGAMQSFHFQIMGATRSHWDFYRGYELSITVVFGIIAILIWQLGTLSRSEPQQTGPAADSYHAGSANSAGRSELGVLLCGPWNDVDSDSWMPPSGTAWAWLLNSRTRRAAKADKGVDR